MTTRLLMAAQVTAVRDLSRRVRAIRVAPIHRRAFPLAAGGDHVHVQHPTGVRRDYSLVSSRGGDYEIAVQRQDAGRGGSALFHASQPGDPVFISYPQPGMSLDATASRHVFVAGGIGVTAIIGLLHDVSPALDGEVHYAVNRRADAVLLDRLEASGLEVHLHVSAEGTRLDVSSLVAGLTPDTALYHCGPPSLMAALDAAGHPPQRTRSEAFAVTARPGERLGEPFTARLLGTGRSVSVAADETLLTALLRDGIPVDYSCEGGVCGSCVIEAPSGDLDHRDRCLSDADRGQRLLATCVSRGRDDIALLI
ncbi:PDR/VanB family oxidoreductase [Microbacterium sp. ZW CA_36]|uniref:PDR/VanB family oxidoreductase n=1 Tax=Microbacterium sp. ZW CA_36 TaxID=3378078 RepID=UPI0038532E38